MIPFGAPFSFLARKDRHFEEAWFLPERSTQLKQETIRWQDQHKPGCPKLAFDFQIPADLEVFATMLLHAVVNPSVRQTLENVRIHARRPGAFKSSAQSINAYLVIDSPAVEAYRLLVNNDRESTIGVSPPQRDLAEESIEEVVLTKANKTRRWITALRLYCAIQGYLPHVDTTDRWKEYVTHFKMKVSAHTPRNF